MMVEILKKYWQWSKIPASFLTKYFPQHDVKHISQNDVAHFSQNNAAYFSQSDVTYFIYVIGGFSKEKKLFTENLMSFSFLSFSHGKKSDQKWLEWGISSSSGILDITFSLEKLFSEVLCAWEDHTHTHTKIEYWSFGCLSPVLLLFLPLRSLLSLDMTAFSRNSVFAGRTAWKQNWLN